MDPSASSLSITSVSFTGGLVIWCQCRHKSCCMELTTISNQSHTAPASTSHLEPHCIFRSIKREPHMVAFVVTGTLVKSLHRSLLREMDPVIKRSRKLDILCSDMLKFWQPQCWISQKCTLDWVLHNKNTWDFLPVRNYSKPACSKPDPPHQKYIKQILFKIVFGLYKHLFSCSQSTLPLQMG